MKKPQLTSSEDPMSGSGVVRKNKSTSVASEGASSRSFKTKQAAGHVKVKSRSSGSEQSIARILDATLEAVSRQGLSSLSMSDVCRVAGVARGTLYRYFSSKEVLLESLGQRTRQQTELGVRQAAASAATGTEALAAVIKFLKEFAEESKAKAMLEIEPLFFMNFLRRQQASYIDVVTDALSKFYDEMDESLGYKVDRKLCSEIFLRLQTSYIFLPDNRTSEQITETIMASLNKVLSSAGQAE